MTLTYSAHVGGNARVFPLILDLYVPEGSTIADVTYGRGVFWKEVDKTRYTVLSTDIKDGIDFRDLPYEESSVDALVLDPPYMHTPGGTAHKGHQNYEVYYGNNAATGDAVVKYHDAVLLLYMQGIKEAARVLKPRGHLILKCQDQVCAGQFRSTLAELSHHLVMTDWTLDDVFVVVSTNRPGISRLKGKQQHARRNHSYFAVASLRKAPRLGTRFSQEYWP